MQEKVPIGVIFLGKRGNGKVKTEKGEREANLRFKRLLFFCIGFIQSAKVEKGGLFAIRAHFSKKAGGGIVYVKKK